MYSHALASTKHEGREGHTFAIYSDRVFLWVTLGRQLQHLDVTGTTSARSSMRTMTCRGALADEPAAAATAAGRAASGGSTEQVSSPTVALRCARASLAGCNATCTEAHVCGQAKAIGCIHVVDSSTI